MTLLSSMLNYHTGWDKSEKAEVQFTSQMYGSHCILELYECDMNKLNDEAFIRTTINLAAKVSGATLLNLITHRFSPQGVTALALLAESHISIHTWPEKKYAAIDVFTCGDQAMPEKACDILIKEFNSQKFDLKRLRRQSSPS